MSVEHIGKGYVKICVSEEELENSIAGLSQGKRWNCSKNLVRPEPEYHIISDREYFKTEPQAIKGYYVDKNSISKGVHSPEYYGYGYLRYTLVKLTDRGG